MSTEEFSDTNQYLTFMLDKEYFTIAVQHVREILEYVTVTKMPDAPNFMRGIINVRGRIVPVLDLRLKFGMEQTDLKPTTRIIVLEIESEESSLLIGSLADSVKEVIEFATDQIDPPPEIGSNWKGKYIKGIVNYKDQFIMLLDIDKLFSKNELTMIDEAGNETEE